ncbi:hypothetical protein [Brucella intermedia]|uniref:hypothetical protein n=1 Tax=Brucella intermedia TaxID=94625 RepID=UPI00200033C1|nr:hypothetical protein [Brucella intermedia]
MTYGYRMRSIATSAIMTTAIFAALVEPAFAQAAGCPSSNDLRLFVLLKIGVSGSV